MLTRCATISFALLLGSPALATEPSVCEVQSATSSAAQVTVDLSSTEYAPDEVIVLGEATSVLTDDGRGADARRGDGIYSTKATDGDVFGELAVEDDETCAPLASSSDSWFDWELECEIEFVPPGGTCSLTGETCSAESMLGGETWFCICIGDCTIVVGSGGE